MKEKLQNQQGYTMVELMIAFSIFTILMMVVYSAFFSQYSTLRGQIEMSSMNADARRTLKHIKEIIEVNGDVNISGDQVIVSGNILIDADHDTTTEGQLLSLDNGTHTLIDQDGLIIAHNVADINMVMGPGTIDGVSVVEDVVLIHVVMATPRTSYEVKGGVNIGR